MSRWERVRSEPAPDLWPEIERRLAGSTGPRSGRAGRVASVIVSTIVIGGLLVWGLVALSGLSSNGQGGPAASLSARIPVTKPQPLVAGEGAIWVVGGTSEHNGTLWRIDPATNTSTELTQTRGAMSPAAGEGWAWVTICNPGGSTKECGSNDLLKIDPATGATVATIHLPSYPFIVYAGLGSVWVSTLDGLVKVDPATDSIAAVFPVKTDVLGSAAGFLWATGVQHGGIAGVAEIDPENGNVVRTVGFHDPCELLATEQAIWVASCQGGLPLRADHLAGFDPRTGDPLYDLPLDRWGSLAFANGTLWVGHWIG